VPTLTEGLERLRAQLAQATFSLGLPGADRGQTTQTELLDQLDDYVLPRLSRLDAPLLAVLGGSTGAGKSTLTNSLVGEEVTRPGVLRPTTRFPVLTCHPDDEAWFMAGGILADLPRSTGERRSTGAGLHVVVSTAMTAGLAILDSPDIDSVETANHDLASQLLGAADLWLFVTTAARYADAVPWKYLARAAERSIALALIINRIPSGAEDEISSHLRSMLGEKGLPAADLFAIAEHDLVDGRIVQGVADIRTWLDDLVSDAERRDEIVRSTLLGAIRSVGDRSDRVADALDEQAQAALALRKFAQQRYEEALDRVDNEVGSGQLLKGEVIDQWRDIVGTGELMDKLQRGIGRLRDKAAALLRGSTDRDEQARDELSSNLEVLVREAANRAALEVAEGWEAMPGGASVLHGAPRGIDRASEDLTSRMDKELGEWQLGVLDLVREMAEPKLASARALSLGINGVGVALMIAVFSSTGGLTGGEAAVAGGTAAVSQTVLSAVFGEQAVRDLVTLVRDDLETRLARVYTVELERFGALLADVPSAETAKELRGAGAAVEAAELT